MADASTFGRNSTNATLVPISHNSALPNVTIIWNASTTPKRYYYAKKSERETRQKNCMADRVFSYLFSQFARVAHIKAEELKQAEKKSKFKDAANAAATSNLPRLNIVDSKEVESKA